MLRNRAHVNRGGNVGVSDGEIILLSPNGRVDMGAGEGRGSRLVGEGHKGRERLVIIVSERRQHKWPSRE